MTATVDKSQELLQIRKEHRSKGSLCYGIAKWISEQINGELVCSKTTESCYIYLENHSFIRVSNHRRIYAELPIACIRPWGKNVEDTLFKIRRAVLVAKHKLKTCNCVRRFINQHKIDGESFDDVLERLSGV